MHRNRIQEQWLRYKEQYLPGVPDDSVAGAQHCFYSGVGAVIAIFGGEEDASVVVEDLKAEVAWLVGQELQALQVVPGVRGNG